MRRFIRVDLPPEPSLMINVLGNASNKAFVIAVQKSVLWTLSLLVF